MVANFVPYMWSSTTVYSNYGNYPVIYGVKFLYGISKNDAKSSGSGSNKNEKGGFKAPKNGKLLHGDTFDLQQTALQSYLNSLSRNIIQHHRRLCEIIYTSTSALTPSWTPADAPSFAATAITMKARGANSLPILKDDFRRCIWRYPETSVLSRQWICPKIPSAVANLVQTAASLHPLKNVLFVAFTTKRTWIITT